MTTLSLRPLRFLKSAPTVEQLPPDKGREVAFIGRSNVGKSSVINTVCDNRKLARKSKTPGRTQFFNVFQLSEEIRVIDLPGYGFANAPKALLKKWQSEFKRYLEKRQSLVGIVMIMDIRHVLTPLDRDMLNLLLEHELPINLVLNKADKLSFGAAKNTLFKTSKALEVYRASFRIQLFSALKKQGAFELTEQLDAWLSPD